VSTGNLAEKRVGLIVPSSNTVVEVDFARSLPADATLHSARMFLAETTEVAERAMITEHLPRAVEDLASLYPDVVAFACTSAGAVLGAEGEARLMEDIAEMTGARVVSTNDAVKNVIVRYNRQRVAVITPYVDELNARIREGLEGRGLTVARIAGLGLTENFAIARVPPAEIVAFAERSLADMDFDLLFVSCTNFRALAARPQLLERFGVPVVTSNQATIEAALAALLGASDGARAGVSPARA
jgi:maleate isomerase